MNKLGVSVFIAFLFGALYVAMQQQPTTPTAAPPVAAPETVQPAIVKSPNDPKAYRAVTLGNQLQVLLVSDPTTDKASAALDVNVGSSDDPRDKEGLAHFLEHMLFLGTEKYPEPDAYQKFISSHGGSHNAYTSAQHTNYFFEVEKTALREALDRFSQQFVAPTFSAEYVTREKNAVHSEYTSRVRDDGRRYFSVIKNIINPEHPYATFAVGNLQTLADTPEQTTRERMLEFYEAHYSANKMRLVILGSESLDTLEGWASELFTAIPNRNVPERNITETIFLPDQLPQKVLIEPVKDSRELQLVFPIESLRTHYRSKPAYYLNNLLGHEGEGSLFAHLKDEGLADSLSAGTSFDNGVESVISINIELTDKGLEQHEQILDLFFEYVALVRDNGIDRWRFDEQARLLDLSFRFQDNNTSAYFVSRLANAMQHHPAQSVLYSSYQMDDFDADLYRRIMDKLTPENMLVTLTAQGLPTERKTQWYDAPYAVTEFSQQRLAEFTQTDAQSPFTLPTPNPFIPEQLELLAEDASTTPTRLMTVAGLEAWHALDTSFSVPRAEFYFSIRSEQANQSPEHSVLTKLLVRLVKDELNEFAYPAHLAGLSYDLYKHVRGITVKISGYNDKQDELLKRITQALQQFSVNPERFAIHKADLERGLLNRKERKPYEQTLGEVRRLLTKPAWTDDEELGALQPVTPERLQDFAAELFAEIKLVSLAVGNISEAQALAMNQRLQDTLLAEATPTEVPRLQVVRLNEGANFLKLLDINHDDAGYTLYIQGPEDGFTGRATMGLVNQLISSRYYNSLRTEKQLGYVVFSTVYPLDDVPGLAFVVQSPSASAEALDRYTREFIQAQTPFLEAMPAEEFAQYQQSLISRLTQKPDNLSKLSDRYWSDIDDEQYNFDTRQQIADKVAALTMEEVVAYYREHVMNDAASRVLIANRGGVNEPDESRFEGYSLIENQQQFRNLLPAF